MAQSPDPYDTVPYRSLPVAWTAPERLALASLLHGGPRVGLDSCRVLELGCGDGANLLPLGYFRRDAEFVGVDAAAGAIRIAGERSAALGLPNVSFVHADFSTADARLSGAFDFIVAHGVFSWVPDETRDAMMALCARRLRRGGLLYLNYNARPGWTVRGIVRDYLRAETAGATDLATRARLARDRAAAIAASLPEDVPHPYVRLIAHEFQLVADKHASYVAHEYLAPDNRSYWRDEFLEIARGHGFEHVADADFSFESGRVPGGLEVLLRDHDIAGGDPHRTIDLMSFRQMHSPVLAHAPLALVPPGPDELTALTVASCLSPTGVGNGDVVSFEHPSGEEVEVADPASRSALAHLRTLWPRGMPVREAFADADGVMDQLLHLHRLGLIELRCREPADAGIDAAPLNILEAPAGYRTTAYHHWEPVP